MKKNINGKTYDTEKATCLARFIFSHCEDADYCYEVLYQKENGEFFLYGEGGANSRYACYVSSRGWSRGKDIIPLTETKAKEWRKNHEKNH